jgi:nicotinate-nucleotide adenylyltransferase
VLHPPLQVGIAPNLSCPGLPASRQVPLSQRIGIFGGTFDPPHFGHVAAVRAVQDALDLDRLLLVVANDPWQKSPTRAITPAEDRFAMAQALAEAIPGVEASRMEIDRGGPSYTVATVETLRAEPASSGQAPPEIHLVLGADLVPELGTWERSEDLKQLVTLAVVSRPPLATTAGASPPKDQPTPSTAPSSAPPGWRVQWVDGPMVDVSSSAVRDLLARGAPIDEVVPVGVVHCIRRRNLYAVGR